MANNSEKEAISSNLSKLVLNNFVIQLCKKIKSARVICTKKLKKQAIKLKEKKTENEEEKRKNISKANSCLKQIDVLKGYQLSNIAKFILLFDKSHDEVFNKPNSRVEEKALSRISHDEKIKNDVSKFREKYPDWKKELPFLIKSLGVLYRKARMKRLEENGKLKTTLENEKKMLILLHELTGLDIDTKILKRDGKKQTKVPKLKKNIQSPKKELPKKNDGVSTAKICDDDESYSDCSMDDESLSIEEMKENGEVISERNEVNKKGGRLIEEGPIKITSIFESCHSDKPLSSVSSNKKKKLKLLKNLDSEGNINITANSETKGKNTPISKEVKIPNLKGTSAARQVKLNENQSEISFERNNNSQLDSSDDDDEPFFQKLHNQANNSEQDTDNNSKSPLSKKLKSVALEEGDDSDTNEMLDYDTRKYFKKKMFRDSESRGSRGRGRGRYTSSDRGFRGSRGSGSSRARNQLVSFNKPRDGSRPFRRFDNDESGRGGGGGDDLKFVSGDFIVGDRNDFDNNQNINQFDQNSSVAESGRGNRGRGYRGRGGRFGNDERGSRRGTRSRGDSRGRGRSNYSDKSSDRGRKKDGFMGSSNHMPLGERKKSTSGGESMLHPSWIAKKNQANSSVASFQGKRTTFD